MELFMKIGSTIFGFMLVLFIAYKYGSFSNYYSSTEHKFNITCYMTDRSTWATANASDVTFPSNAARFKMNTKGSPVVYVWDNCTATEVK